MKHWKILVFSATVCAFFVQGFFVYTNFGYDSLQVVLSTDAQHGLKVWRSNNCQVCHQIHGFGGFLGPDLTNVIQRRSLRDIHQVLISGRAKMPAFNLSEKDRHGVLAFLTETDQTGTGYPTLVRGDPFTLLTKDTNALAANNSKAHAQSIGAGMATMQTYGCNACHVPFRAHIGPDLTNVLTRRDAGYIEENIRNGRGQMPSFPMLDKSQIRDIVVALTFINQNRRMLLDEKLPRLSYLMELPWFEY